MNIPLIPVLLTSHLFAAVLGFAGTRMLFASRHRDPARGSILGAVIGLVGGLIILYVFWLAFLRWVSVRARGGSVYTELASGFKSVRRIEGLGVAGVLLVLYAVFIMTSEEVFTKPRIYTSFMQTVSPQLIIALGLTLVITAGEIDLSFPAVVALSGFVFAWSYKNIDASWGPWAGLSLAILAGAGVGLINGWIVAWIGVPSIMATLAAQFFWYGVTVLLADGKQLALRGVRDGIDYHIRDERLFKLFVGKIDGILPDQNGVPVGLPSQALWALGLTIMVWLILNRHKFGEAVLFVGDNAEVARVMGIDVGMTRIKLFVLMGALSGFAGVLVTLDNWVFYPTQGEGFLLPVMSAVFIGGTSFAGGQGVVFGTLFGAY
ncbi:MAG: ABC transporter permease, partial [Chloroflexi bacterium]|nr:ABC transporter permease [Chloroflexota bacterium]